MSLAYMSLVLILAIALLLLMVLKLKVQAFLSLMIISMAVGVAMGMPVEKIFESIQSGMGSTLGFVATVVGLGAIFGQILESSGGAHSLAHSLVRYFGKDRAQWAMAVAGFLVAIPIFFDVGFIILVPLVYALSKDTGKPLLFYGIPLLASLSVTHCFVPPTPGPVAVAQILHADIGWVILLGIVVGIPVAIISGPLFGAYISNKVKPDSDPVLMVAGNTTSFEKELLSFRLVLSILLLPITLIVIYSIVKWLVDAGNLQKGLLSNLFMFLGHPFAALTLATLSAIYFLGIRQGKTRAELLNISTKSLAPAGLIILVTGAGGVFKQVLVDSGIGVTLANVVADSGIPLLLLAYVLAVIIRVSQGSATVAMITGAGIISPVIDQAGLHEMEKALVVLVIAAGAMILSHVNDSGFWLVGKYLGLSEKQTLGSWTVMGTILSISGFLLVLILNAVLHLWI
jgi:Gnt-I system low-affinity gluconate transporter